MGSGLCHYGASQVQCREPAPPSSPWPDPQPPSWSAACTLQRPGPLSGWSITPTQTSGPCQSQTPRTPLNFPDRLEVSCTRVGLVGAGGGAPYETAGKKQCKQRWTVFKAECILLVCICRLAEHGIYCMQGATFKYAPGNSQAHISLYSALMHKCSSGVSMQH
eukprot:1160217-Pelagomonas_calceolata.AAC.7